MGFSLQNGPEKKTYANSSASVTSALKIEQGIKMEFCSKSRQTSHRNLGHTLKAWSKDAVF